MKAAKKEFQQYLNDFVEKVNQTESGSTERNALRDELLKMKDRLAQIVAQVSLGKVGAEALEKFEKFVEQFTQKGSIKHHGKLESAVTKFFNAALDKEKNHADYDLTAISA